MTHSYPTAGAHSAQGPDGNQRNSSEKTRRVPFSAACVSPAAGVAARKGEPPTTKARTSHHTHRFTAESPPRTPKWRWVRVVNKKT